MGATASSSSNRSDGVAGVVPMADRFPADAAGGAVAEHGGLALAGAADPPPNEDGQHDDTTTSALLPPPPRQQQLGNGGSGGGGDGGEEDGLFVRSSEQSQQSQVQRTGTIASACFNMWSTMVGGGCLSLPLALAKTGNALTGPLILIGTACTTQFCFAALIAAQRSLSPPSSPRATTTTSTKGTDTYESIAAHAFGKHMYRFGTALVTLMCFFGIVGYAVLLRDMLQPITDAVFSSASSSSSSPPNRGYSPAPAWQDNAILLTVVLLVTPLCTLQTLTALEKFGAASMASILILGCCILYRGVQCTFSIIPHHTHPHGNGNGSHSRRDWMDGFQFFPAKWKDVLDVIPLFISCFVCHYNLPVVHNELADPTPARVRTWLRTTVWGSTAFYVLLGTAGAAYRPCSAGGDIEGNILLNFPRGDRLVLVGRLCLAVTITLAFPMLTIPARDILLRVLREHPTTSSSSDATAAAGRHGRRRNPHGVDGIAEQQQRHVVVDRTADDSMLLQPLLSDAIEPPQQDSADDGESFRDAEQQPPPGGAVAAGQNAGSVFRTGGSATPPHAPTPAAVSSFGARLWASMAIFWTGAAVACCVRSIDVVWDLLGSSLSILVSFLIPCGSYLVLVRRAKWPARWTAWTLIMFFVPLMFISTANAVYDTFIKKQS
jgi:amino acid permease